MTDREVPEADAVEQAQELDESEGSVRPVTPRVGIDVPEADALEQAQPAGESEAPVRPATPNIGPETPEADAIEQAQEVPIDEDEAGGP